MTVRARLRWTLVTAWACSSFITVLWNGPSALAVAFLVPVPWTLWRRMRLTADDNGITIVNLFRTLQVPWAETLDFEWSFVRLSSSIDVCVRDGGRVRFWFATGGDGPSRRSPNHPIAVVRRLRWLRAEALGEPAPPADLAQIDEALAAAEAGDRTRSMP